MAIAVDAMGGDYPLSAPVQGAIQAIHDFGIEVILVGDENQIKAELQNHRYDSRKLHLAHCSEIVTMSDKTSQALRHKKDSSIRVAMNLHKEGRASAVVSAGHSGVTMATAKFVLKMIEGIERPAITAIMPALKGKFVFLDAGANTDCKASYLLQFAIMGGAYAESVWHVDRPLIALLNNGSEEGKGKDVVKEAYQLLKKSTLNFIGNVEGKTMFHGESNVVVCDGFVGNISLKVAEGTIDFVKSVLREETEKSFLAKLGYWGMKTPFQKLKQKADYTELGGAILLGVRGNVIICHGNSTAHTIRNAIRHADQCVQLGLNERIEQNIAKNMDLNPSFPPIQVAS